MAQLIKLQDYVSRYEWNPFHYPTQFIRLKRQNWNKLRDIWEEELDMSSEADESEKKWGFFNENNDPYTEMNDLRFLQTEDELIKYYLDRLFPFQMKWATSTVSQLSYTDQKYYTDDTLKYFLQRFPDIYLVMYYPIFNVQKAPVDGEVILISPVGIDLIKLIERPSDVTIMATDERSWTFESTHEINKELSPLFALKRNENIIKSILNKYNINLPIHKTVLSRTNNVVYVTEPYNTSFVGKLNYENWFIKKRQLSAPLKSEQLKAMEALLLHCQTTSIKRPEWEEDDDTLLYVDGE